MAKIPARHKGVMKRFPAFGKALESLGKAAREAGPIDEKTSHLIQMAAAAATRSEGAVHSHARRAIEAGATKAELFHAVLLITSTCGFPTAAAALSWVEDVVKGK